MTADADAMLANSVIIVCHPDDEVLWFGSILGRVDRVIIAYEDYFAKPGLGAARAAVLRDFPRPVESLRLPEAGTYGLADWNNPRLNDVGIAFRPATRGIRELKRRAMSLAGNVLGPVAPVAERCASDRYAANHAALLEALRPRLSAGMNVFTHNPWGEYGHEDHIQMFRVLDRLRREIGFTLWMSNYCTERSFALAKTYFQLTPSRPVRLPVDHALCDTVADIYKRHDCWTWADDWCWFEDEYFLEAPLSPAEGGAQRHLFPMNMFTIDADAPDRWLLKAAGVTAAAAGMGMAAVMSELV
jgi:LmbE family N-acetylglucosaminyl deacetylase